MRSIKALSEKIIKVGRDFLRSDQLGSIIIIIIIIIIINKRALVVR